MDIASRFQKYCKSFAFMNTDHFQGFWSVVNENSSETDVKWPSAAGVREGVMVNLDH